MTRTKVSIHAPAKGATAIQKVRGRGQRGFNPRAREGRDKCHHITLHHPQSFNPRAREGRDVI